jgi:ATP-dependent RNA helicase RhlE
VRQLEIAGLNTAAIHGDKSQAARERALDGFRAGRIPVLVATDIAARGIDVDAISHVFNYDMPNVAETYVHRIGRTGRAGAVGIALSFCDHEERGDLKAIERLIRRPIEVHTNHPEYQQPNDDCPAPAGQESGANGQQQLGRRFGSGRPAPRRPQPAGGQQGQARHGSGNRRFGQQEGNRGGSGSRSRGRRRGRKTYGKKKTTV